MTSILHSFQYPTITFTLTALYIYCRSYLRTLNLVFYRAFAFRTVGNFFPWMSFGSFFLCYALSEGDQLVKQKEAKNFSFFKKKAIPINQIISHYRNQMKDHSVNDVTVSLYSYSFDLPRRVKRNFMKRSMCGSSLVGTQTIGTRSRTIATYELWSS